MAAKKTAPKKEYPLAHLVEKDITPLMQNYADWLREQTGYDVDDRSVALAGTQRMKFQKSEENQADLEARRQAAEARKAEIEQNRAAKKAEKADSKKATAVKPAAKGKAPAKSAAKAPAKPAPRRRRAADDDDI